MKLREIVLGAMMAAMALVIPLYFGFARVILPPEFTATLASHVPVMLAMFISPWVAGVAGLGSALGFLMVLGPVIAARASIHIIWAVMGAILYRRGFKPAMVLVLILPLHAIGEALVLVPFGIPLAAALLVTGVGTAIHHVIDAGITLAVLGALAASGVAFTEMRRREKRGTGDPVV